jgi:hypothetical protein
VRLSGEVECDEVYVVAGHKGHPAAVEKRATRPPPTEGGPGPGDDGPEKPPIFGMIQRAGEIVICMLADVKQRMIGPLIRGTITPGAIVDTDEYDIHGRLPQWGYTHHTVCHAAGEFARDDDGDGFCEVHVNTLEGFRSLLRSWLRPRRGISQERLPHLGFFEFVHNVRRRCWGR